MIKAIIFDCFGVVYEDNFGDVYEHFGGDLKKDEKLIHDTFHASNSGKISSSTTVFANHFGVSEEEWQRVNDADRGVNEELLEYIKKLNEKYKTALLTNIGIDGVERYITTKILDEHFDVVVESAKIGFAKPEARAYEITADKLSVRLDECIFIDDREEYTEGATRVGMQAILYKDLNGFKNELAERLND